MKDIIIQIISVRTIPQNVRGTFQIENKLWNNLILEHELSHDHKILFKNILAKVLIINLLLFYIPCFYRHWQLYREY